VSRSLRITPRPFLALGIVLSPVALLGMVGVVRGGFRSDLLLMAISPFGLYAAVMLAICSTRITVIDDGINVSSYFVFARFIPFGAIDHSDVQIVAERDHPALVTIHYRDGKSVRRLSLSLKSYRREDVAWLCALPEMRARTHPGFTKRRWRLH